MFFCLTQKLGIATCDHLHCWIGACEAGFAFSLPDARYLASTVVGFGLEMIRMAPVFVSSTAWATLDSGASKNENLG